VWITRMIDSSWIQQILLLWLRRNAALSKSYREKPAEKSAGFLLHQ